MLSLVFHLCELNIFNSGCYVIVTFEIVKMFDFQKDTNNDIFLIVTQIIAGP